MTSRIGKFIKENYHYAVMAIIILLAFMLCFDDTINFDEYYTLNWCRLGWKDLIQALSDMDQHPPLHYFVRKLLMLLSGENLFILRLWSLAGLITILTVGGSFVKKLWGSRAFWFFIITIYINPYMLLKASEVRMYIWASTFIVLNGIAAYGILAKKEKKSWIIFTITAVLAAYTHYFCILTLIFVYLGLAFFFIIRKEKTELKRWLICSLVTIAAYLPWLPFLYRQFNNEAMPTEDNTWISAPTSKMAALRDLFDSEIPYTEHLFPLLFGVGFLALLVLFVKTKETKYYWALLCNAAIWGVMVFGILFAKLSQPILMSRYLIMPVCLAILGLCVLIKKIPWPIVFIFCTFMLLIGGIRYRGYFTESMNHQATDTIRFANGNIREGDLIIFSDISMQTFQAIQYEIPQAKLKGVSELTPQAIRETVNDKDADTCWIFDFHEQLSDKEAVQTDYILLGNYGFDGQPLQIYKMN